MLDLKLIHSKDLTVTQLQHNTRTVLNSVGEDIDGCLQANQVISDVSFPVANQDVIVPHKLGRSPIGYTMTGANAPAAIYTSSTPNPSPTTQLILRASATGAVTADLLVF